MDNPKCPAMMPAKNTNVTPNEMPQTCIFPNPNPIAEISESTTTACKAECSTNKLYSQSNVHSILQFQAAKIVQTSCKIKRTRLFFMRQHF